ncbi:hypothetical protein PQ459_04850 [Chryseobacterium sp. KACC 21268]|nr:hypothetical protein PQ459_04850 [Chryseobacterium sp. KACC 21268]
MSINLDLLIGKIKLSNSGFWNYQFTYNPKELKSIAPNKSINNSKGGQIPLKVYRNPKIGNVGVKWDEARITHTIDFQKEKIYYRLHFYYKDSNESAFILETEYYKEFRDLNILLNYGDVDEYKADYDYFLKNFANALRNETDAARLKFIYKNIPESILSNLSTLIDNETFFNHLEILSADDDSNIFKDSSTAVIQIFKTFDNPIPILNYYRQNPNRLNRLYYNLDRNSEYDGKIISNKMVLANIMMVLSMRAQNENRKKTAKTFTIGKGYKINSDILEFGALQGGNKKYADTFFLQQQKDELQRAKIIPKEGDPDAMETVTVDMDQGGEFYPLDMVYLKDLNEEKEVMYLVPAIYLKALADAEEWEVVMQNIRIAADLVAVVIGVLTLPTGNPYFLLLAIADIALAGADLTIQAFREQISQIEGGEEFLKTWDSIYAVGGALTGGVLLISSFYKLGLKLLTLPEVVKNIKLKNTIITHIVGVLLDVNLINFERNSVKILTDNNEIVLATSGALDQYRMTKLQEQGVILLSGDVNKGNKVVTEYNMVYNSSIVAKGDKASFYKQIKDVGRNYYKEEKLVDVLEEMEDDVWKYFDKEPASGTSYETKRLIDKYTSGNSVDFEKGVKYLTEKERESYEVFVQHDKIVDVKGNLMDTNGSVSIIEGENPFTSNKAIFVMSEKGNIYISKTYELGKFHHSSFLAGKPVAVAGEIFIEKGIIKEITDGSGHYQVSLDVVKNNSLEELNARNYFIYGTNREVDIKFSRGF